MLGIVSLVLREVNKIQHGYHHPELEGVAGGKRSGRRALLGSGKLGTSCCSAADWSCWRSNFSACPGCFPTAIDEAEVGNSANHLLASRSEAGLAAGAAGADGGGSFCASFSAAANFLTNPLRLQRVL